VVRRRGRTLPGPASWVSDDDIAACTPGTPAPADEGPVVIDLTDKTRDRQGREP